MLDGSDSQIVMSADVEQNGGESQQQLAVSASRSPRPRNENNSSHRSRSPIGASLRRRSRSRSPNRDNRRRRKRSESPKRTDDRRMVFISNIPYDMRWMELKDLIREKAGEVSFVEVIEKDGRSKGCAVVEFKNRDGVLKCLDNIHRLEIGDRKLIVKEIRDPRAFFNKIREEYGVDFMANRSVSVGGRSGESSKLAAAAPFGFETYGLSPAFLSQLGIEGQLCSRVFVANLSYTVSSSKLKEVFSLAGQVIDVDIQLDKDGKNKGLAVIEFSHPIEAVQSISMLHHQDLFERPLTVKMDRFEKAIEPRKPGELPVGLRQVGMGLGANGAPLENITQLVAAGNFGPATRYSNSGSNGSSAPVVAQSPFVNDFSVNKYSDVGSGGGLSGSYERPRRRLDDSPPRLGYESSRVYGNSQAFVPSGYSSSAYDPYRERERERERERDLPLYRERDYRSIERDHHHGVLESRLPAPVGGGGVDRSSYASGAGGVDRSYASSAGGVAPALLSAQQQSSMVVGSGSSYYETLMSSSNGRTAVAPPSQYAAAAYGMGVISSGGAIGAPASAVNIPGQQQTDAYGSRQASVVDYETAALTYGHAISPPSSSSLAVGRAPGAMRSSLRAILIRNLPMDYSWQTLRDRMRGFGEVEFADIIQPGVGKIRFKAVADAEKACISLHGMHVEGRPITVDLVKSD